MFLLGLRLKVKLNTQNFFWREIMDCTSKIRNQLLFIFILLLSANFTYGQQKGNISGKVIDASNKDPLYGANVFIENTAIGSATDSDGNYKIINLNPGKYTLIYRYLGFKTKTVELTVTAGRTIQNNVELELDAITGDEVVVTGLLQGQAAAINQQINSNTIVNIVSKDKIDELPDANVAESIGRLPGISIQRDAGEGSKVIIRGLSPRFNSITVNGERIPATDPNDRSVDLSMISQDILSGIEVFKALTPDKDGDAIGGSINLITKNAPNNLQLNVLAQGGYNDHESDFGQYKTSLSASDRYFENKLGILATASAQRANRSSDLLNADYTSDGAQIPVISVANLNLADRIETRDRYSAGLNFDYAFENGSIRLNNFYSRTDRDEIRRRKRYRVDEFRVEYDIRERQVITDLITTSLLGEYNIDAFDIDFQTSFSNSEQNTPYSNYGRFQEVGAYNNGLNATLGPQAIPQYARNDLSQTWFQYGTFNPEIVKDKDLTAQLNLQYQFKFGDDISGFVKSGLKYRDKDREKNTNEYRTPFGETDKIGQEFSDRFDLVTGHILMSNFIDDGFKADDFLEGQYDFGPGINNKILDNFHQNYKSRYIINRYIELSNYNAGESIFAGYLMTQVNITNNLMLLPGFRYEKTENNYEGKVGKLRGNEGQTGTIRDSADTNSYEEWLPMFHVKYNVFDGADIRLAYTESIARPDYFNLVPYESISDAELTIVRGNPNLKHTSAKNYDAYFSLYNNYGLFSIGGFYKELKNIDYIFTYRETEGQFTNYTITEPINSPNAKVYGFEIEIQTNLRFLPSPFDGVVISANYTQIKSETEFPYFEIGPRSTTPPYRPTIIKGFRKGRMPGQADNIINLSLGYEKAGFTGRISLLHQGEITSSIGQRSEFDTYTASFTRVDMSLSQKIMENFSLFLNVNNLTNLSEGAFFGVEDRPVDQEYFGWTADFGIKYKLN